MKWLLITIFFLTGAGSVSAQGLNFLQDAPIAKFKQADIDMLLKTLNQALDSGADGVPVTWANPSAGNSGSITPEKGSQVPDGCRKARVESRHKQIHSTSHAVFCKIDGKWKALS